MRCGWPSSRWTCAPAPKSALARVVNVFGAARPHHAYLFANRRANRMKVLVHDGIGVWLAARRLQPGQVRLAPGRGATLTLTRAQLDALVLGLPWQRIGEAGVITRAVARTRAIAGCADARSARAAARSRSVIDAAHIDTLEPEQLREVVRSLMADVARAKRITRSPSSKPPSTSSRTRWRCSSG